MEKAVVIVTNKAPIEEIAAGGSGEAIGDGGTADGVANKAIGAGKITVALD